MTRQKKQPPQKQPVSSPRNNIEISSEKAREEKLQKTARVPIEPCVSTYRIITAAEGKSGIGRDADGPSLVKHLYDQSKAVKAGDLSQIEDMLTAQATSLQSLFTCLVERGFNQSFVNNFELMMKLALRAQSQCRATLETLASIKNPPVRINAGQANVSNGPQQVNNVAGRTDLPEKEKQHSKLLEEHDVEWVDTGAEGKAGKGDSEMGTLVEVDRTTDRRRKTKSIS